MVNHLARPALLSLLTLAAAGCAGPPAEVPVFCYRWLTDITCYAEPLADADARLVGGYVADADDPSGRLYWLRRARMSR